MSSFRLPPFFLSYSLPLLFLLPLLPHPTLCQINNANGQYGSFFTAIYLNGSPLPASSVSCNNMGGGGYCCSSSSTCGWDANQNVACCSSGSSCSGSAQQAAPQQYAQPAAGACETCGCNTCNQQEATVTVVQTPAAVAPAVVQQTYPQQQQYTTVAPPETTTVEGVAAGGVTVKTEVPVGQACGAGGYTTLVYQNVGEPARTVGCYVIYNAGAAKVWGEGMMGGRGWGWGVWVVGMVVWGGWIGLR